MGVDFEAGAIAELRLRKREPGGLANFEVGLILLQGGPLRGTESAARPVSIDGVAELTGRQDDSLVAAETRAVAERRGGEQPWLRSDVHVVRSADVIQRFPDRREDRLVPVGGDHQQPHVDGARQRR